MPCVFWGILLESVPCHSLGTFKDPDTFNAQECRILKDLCTSIKSKHPAMFLSPFIILCNSIHPHMAYTSQDMLQGDGLPSIQPGCFSVLFLCAEPLGKVLKVLDWGETKMLSQWWCSGSSKSQRKYFWRVSIGCCVRGMCALLPIASICNGLVLWPESSWMGFGSTSFMFKTTRRKSKICMDGKVRDSEKWGNTCCSLVESLLFFCLLSKSIKIEIHKVIRGWIQNFLYWCRHMHSSCVSTKHQ